VEKEEELMEEQVPRSWVGQRVEAGILEAEGLDQYGLARGLTEQYRTGTLEAVNDLGIVATLELATEDDNDEEEGEAVGTFYPWAAVLWLRVATA